LANSTRQKDWVEIRRTNFGFDQKCDYTTPFLRRRECQNSEHPQIAVWGDSFAMHLVPGLKETDPGLGVIQATHRLCGPLFALAPVLKLNREWANECFKFNESFRTYLAATPGLRYVILSSFFGQYLGNPLLDTGEWVQASPQLVTTYLGKTVLELRAMGKKVVIVAPPPMNGFNVGLCTERLKNGLWMWNAPQNCLISTKLYYETQGEVISMLKETSRMYDVSVIWLSDYLCDVENCKVWYNDVPIYMDNAHLSYSGSEAIFRGFDLFNKVMNASR
jgi:SGNH domain-containing protein